MGSELKISGHEYTKLCNNCKNIPAAVFQHLSDLRPRAPVTNHRLIDGREAFEKLKLSAAAGCRLCLLLEDALRIGFYDPDKYLSQYPDHCEGIRLASPRPGNLRIEFGFCYKQIDQAFTVHANGSMFRPFYSTPDDMIVESDSPATFALIRSWLEECRSSHKICRGNVISEPPKRLLDVSVPSTFEAVRLCSTSNLHDKNLAYIALSHCWGQQQPLKTTLESLQENMNGIREDRLPPTFYDAVRTCRQLGIRYLWIDSLCIVQDDETDFEVECARMNSIYANAVLTIAASDAKDSSEGLFKSRKLKPVRLVYKDKSSTPELTVTMQPVVATMMQELRGPLQTRAWVLQERHMSPRIVHYTKKGLMWECREAVASEYQRAMSFKDKVDESDSQELSCIQFSGILGKKDLTPPLSHVSVFYNSWYICVEQYSCRLLSRPEDRLPALAGFAAEWERINPGDQYLAGLWKSDLLVGLTWFPSFEEHHIKFPLPKVYEIWPPETPFKGIPSWSWAAFDGPVAHRGQIWGLRKIFNEMIKIDIFRRPCPVELHSTGTNVIGKNPYGRVSGATIGLSSWSIIVTVSESDFAPGSLFSGDEGPKAYRVYPPLGGLVYFDHSPHCLPKIDILFLQLGRGRTIRGTTAEVCGLALLLVCSTNTTQDVYTRVGMFEIDDYDSWSNEREKRRVEII
ncbi:heterokaryon incompatibility protein-domain-containing protein [Daldinia sp. FL1419]|nr:heterokaryon incompatibility protein-domain-containing protein [Daldinia sp. FL1419]